ncbi:MAG TPA: DUF1501 domain-containing protein [Pirellulaceae bacterium]|nr:DUF1501 domain-containing protein [Pirellulaceae bacterium]
MLTISRTGLDESQTTRLSRRTFLVAGAIGGGLSLASLLRAEAAAGIGSSRKAVIFVHLDGGPPHLDTIDLKPEAPSEIRGEFSGIPTTIAGYRICEHLPKLASLASKLVFVRSLVGAAGAHDAFQCQSGFEAKDLASVGGRPALGCVVHKLQGKKDDPAPSFVDLMQGRALVRNSARPGFLGPSYAPFRPDISHLFHRELEPGMKGELARRGESHTQRLSLLEELSADRLTSRTSLLSGLDKLRRRADAAGMMDAMDSFTQQAVGILTSGQFADSLDLSKEDPRVLSRYALATSASGPASTTSDDAGATKKFLLARRLIEAGVRCVSISISDFDTHSSNFPRMKRVLPIVDHGLGTLIEELDERGMLGDVSIVAWGEFGRTPTIDAKSGGRHHWPAVGPALLAGGGMRGGQVIGETDRYGRTAVSRPVHYKDVFATLYHNLGLPARQTTVTDPSGRPQYLLDAGEVIREAV